MATEKSPAYQRYPNDYLTDAKVVAMTLEEEGAYNRLLDYCWKEGSLPNDMDELAAMCKNIPVKRMEKLWVRVGRCFRPHPTDPSRLTNKRLDAERERQKEWKNKQADAGRRGAAKRWGGHSEPNGVAIPTPMAKNSIASSSASSSSSSIKEAATASSLDEELETFISDTLIIANRGMKEAAFGEYVPILWNHPSRQYVYDWVVTEGIDRELILRTVLARAKEAGKQIRSMRYFDEAVRQAHDRKRTEIVADSEAGRIRAQGPVAEQPKDEASKRSGQIVKVGSTDEAALRINADVERVDEWRLANIDEANRIRARIQQDMLDKGMDALGQRHFDNAVDAHFRKHILANYLTPKLEVA